MQANYLEISTKTLEDILQDKNILDTIIYEGKYVLSNLDLNSYDTALEIQAAIFNPWIEETKEKHDIDTESPLQTLSYKDFPGYTISYQTPEKVKKKFDILHQILQKNYFKKNEELKEWFQVLYKFYKTASERRSAALFCVT